MRKISYIMIILFLTAVMSFVSCGGSGTKTITDPKELGEAIGKNYDEMFDKLIAVLESTDDIDKLKEDVAALKEEYIQIFVEYGKMREELDEADRPKVDSAVLSYNRNLDMDRFQKYSDLQQELSQQDYDLGKMVSSFNILTQYAFFELLKRQEPEEAERLGIE
jgi:hypothetical protein